MFGKLMRLASWMFAAALFAAFALPSVAAPVQNPKARPGDCVACHKAEKVLPAKHEATQDMKFKDCAECHEPKTEDTLSGKMSGAHLHRLNGVDCAKCHGTKGKPTEVAAAKCTSCHDTAKLVAKTANVKPKNPHTSPHYGPDADCNICHHQHAKSEIYCNECHDFKYRVP